MPGGAAGPCIRPPCGTFRRAGGAPDAHGWMAAVWPVIQLLALLADMRPPAMAVCFRPMRENSCAAAEALFAMQGTETAVDPQGGGDHGGQ